MSHSKYRANIQSLSISIVRYDSVPQELIKTLWSVLIAIRQLGRSHPRIKVNLIVVDNSTSSQISLEDFALLFNDLKKVDCNFQLIQGQGNVGYGSGQNLAFESQTTIYHVFMNPDVIVDSDCLVSGVTFLESNEDVAIVSPFADDGKGNKRYLCKRYPSILDFFLRGFMPKYFRSNFSERMAYYEMRDLSEKKASKEVSIVSGCFMLCRSEVIRQVAGFDPRFFLYFEDFDLSLRVGKIAAIAYLPSMRITHTGGDTAMKGLRHIVLFIRSGFRFYFKHGWLWFRR